MRNDGMENLFEPIIGSLVGKYSFELLRMVTPLEDIEVCDMNGNFILELICIDFLTLWKYLLVVLDLYLSFPGY